MDKFYAKIQESYRTTCKLSEEEKTIVLIRVAIEESSREVGIVPTLHILSKLMTSTLEILAEDDDVLSEDRLANLDVEDLLPN
jgi:hypothetical protein